MHVKAHAKVNLFLQVIGRRVDGYHLLQMIMAPISLADELHLRPIERGVELLCDDSTLPAGADNLVVRAALAVLKAGGCDQGVEITLDKKIPSAAGLGGGSSDAAATLRAVRELYELPVADERMYELAVGLGADVPFFLTRHACLVGGIGEQLNHYSVPENLPLALIKPPQGLSTPKVYQALGWPLTQSVKATTLPAALSDGESVAKWLFNDLETPAISLLPEVAQCKQTLQDSGSLGVLMSGSGPTVFGIFDDPAQAQAACLRAESEGYWAFSGTLHQTVS